MRRLLRPLVLRQLRDRRAAPPARLDAVGHQLDALRAALQDAEARVADLERRVERLGRRLDALPRPFHGGMTVHEAWAAHPGAAAVFARHHLPACPDCPVGADETLAEAAFGYALPLHELLAALNALWTDPPVEAADPAS